MNKPFQFGWWLIIFTIILMYLLSGVLTWLFPGMNYYLLAAISELSLFVSIFFGCRYSKKENSSLKEILGLYKFSPRKILPSSFMMLGAQPFITFVTLPIQLILIILFGAEINTTLLDPPATTYEFIYAFGALCIVAPITEELLCRGVLITIFKKYGFYMTLFSSTLVFTLLHFDARSFIQIFFLGLILTYFRMSTGSVYLTILLHAINNFIALLQLSFSQSSFLTVFSFITVVLAVLLPILMISELRKNRLKDLVYTYPKTKKAGFSTALMICIILFVVFNILLVLGRIFSGEMFEELKNLFLPY